MLLQRLRTRYTVTTHYIAANYDCMAHHGGRGFVPPPGAHLGRSAGVQEPTVALYILLASLAYFLCGVLRKERGEKSKRENVMA